MPPSTAFPLLCAAAAAAAAAAASEAAAAAGCCFSGCCISGCCCCCCCWCCCTLTAAVAAAHRPLPLLRHAAVQYKPETFEALAHKQTVDKLVRAVCYVLLMCVLCSLAVLYWLDVQTVDELGRAIAMRAAAAHASMRLCWRHMQRSSCRREHVLREHAALSEPLLSAVCSLRVAAGPFCWPIRVPTFRPSSLAPTPLRPALRLSCRSAGPLLWLPGPPVQPQVRLDVHVSGVDHRQEARQHAQGGRLLARRV